MQNLTSTPFGDVSIATLVHIYDLFDKPEPVVLARKYKNKKLFKDLALLLNSFVSIVQSKSQDSKNSISHSIVNAAEDKSFDLNGGYLTIDKNSDIIVNYIVSNDHNTLMVFETNGVNTSLIKYGHCIQTIGSKEDIENEINLAKQKIMKLSKFLENMQ